MKLLRALRISTKALFAHKVRTILALASVSVGVAAVIVTGGIGTAVKEEVLQKTETMGTNLLVVSPAQIKATAARKQIRGVVTNLKIEDYQAITELASVAESAPGVVGKLTVKSDHTAMSTTVLGTTSSYLEVCRFRLRQGRFFDDDDNTKEQRVAVLGARISENLFEGGDAIGQDIRIRGIPFEIIGVLEAKGVLADGSDEDDQILIPVRTALRRVFNATWLNPIFISVRDSGKMDQAEHDIAHLLRSRHRLDLHGRPDDFSIQNKTKILAAQRQVADTLNLLATGLAAASLIVGGTGILALMLMSVKERTGEIGLRMAVGARQKDILVQFLMEATILATSGWLAGLGIGALGVTVIAFATTWKVVLSAKLVFLTLCTMFTTGLLFGAYPARKASLMPPMQGLLVE